MRECPAPLIMITPIAHLHILHVSLNLFAVVRMHIMRTSECGAVQHWDRREELLKIPSSQLFYAWVFSHVGANGAQATFLDCRNGTHGCPSVK